MPQPLQKLNSSIASALRRGAAFLTPNASSDSLPKLDNSPFATAPSGQLFPQVDPAIDGQDCFDDCATCTTHLPAKWSIDEDKKLYGDVKGWSTHLLVATGKTDWVRDVEDEKGSVMEAVGKCGIKPSNGARNPSLLSSKRSPASPAPR
ncbi:hypothetical protein LPUS_05355 [Lasallia pustulata]|uniref:Uncharacterized protein n=1 Tax=Lasallia pustulata TaxID=136370 RepID=A0A1W5CYX1_9LECA|nr:hypothetical protein LPUS_05355 [Lasallia pustulata]